MAHTKNVREIVDRLKIADRKELERLELEYADDPRAGLKRAFAAAHKRLDSQEAEHSRVEEMYSIMRESKEGTVIAGVDEVGRGAVAGPLTVAAVILPNKPIIEGLNDSKKLSAAKREELDVEIRSRAIAIGISNIDPAQIDLLGMSASIRKAMSDAIDALGIDVDLVLIDGNPVHVHPNEQCIVKGDSKVACIAAASIVAKVSRDSLMIKADASYPGYDFASNKGYASAEHVDAIKRHGLSDFHRQTFCTSFLQESLF